MMIPYFSSLFLFATSSPPVDTVRLSLIAKSDQWFFWVVVSSVVVGIGVCLEGPEATIALKRWYLHWKNREGPPENTRSLAIPASYLGLLLVILGVAGEGIFESLSSKAETALRAHDEQVLADTISEAGVAKDSANTAVADAKAAGEQSRQASAFASNSRTLATGARREADSFEQDIASAKQQAAEAESHLADAMNRAKTLTAELERLTTPRRVPQSVQALAPIKDFAGTEYMFTGTCPVDECFNLVSDIDELLQAAKWKRVKGPVMRIGISQVDIHGDKDFAVDESISTGIHIAVETPGGLEAIKNLTIDQLAEYVRAAIALRGALASNVSPPENSSLPVGIDTGSSTVVKIDIGWKPYQ